MSYLQEIAQECLVDIKKRQETLIRTWKPFWEKVTPEVFFSSVFKKTLNQDYRRTFVINHNFSKQFTCNDLDTFLVKQERFSFFTPQTYWHYRSRTKEKLSRLNCFVLDFDLTKDGTGRDYTIDELCDVIFYGTGLLPHFIYPTKTEGNYNAVFIIKSVTATSNRIFLYEAILKRLAIILGSDFGATDAAHVFRIPKGDIFQFKSTLEPYDLDDFKIILENDEINNRLEDLRRDYLNSNVVSLSEHQIMNLKSVKKLLNCDIEDRRNNSCFTLALLFYSLGKNKSDVEAFFENHWYPLANSKRFDTYFSLKEIRDSVNSAFSGKYAGPSREWIESLTDEPFPINIYRSSYVKKSDDERIYMDKNTIRSRLLEWIRDNPGKQVRQKELAAILDTSYRSLKYQIKQLKEEGVLELEVVKEKGINKGSIFSVKENRFTAEVSVENIFDYEHLLREKDA